VVVLYLMENLYRRTLWIYRNYAYLAVLETDIQANLGMEGASFTREGKFYWQKRDWLLGWVKFFYIVVLGGLLGALLCGRLVRDLRSGPAILTSVDAVVGGTALAFFIAYVKASISLDQKQ
jgi:hypothetical protein